MGRNDESTCLCPLLMWDVVFIITGGQNAVHPETSLQFRKKACMSDVWLEIYNTITKGDTRKSEFTN